MLVFISQVAGNTQILLNLSLFMSDLFDLCPGHFFYSLVPKRKTFIDMRKLSIKVVLVNIGVGVESSMCSVVINP